MKNIYNKTKIRWKIKKRDRKRKKNRVREQGKEMEDREIRSL